MAEFISPVIQDNPTGWGPCQLPEKFKDMPYQPFSKSDRLGKVSDWTGATYTDRKYVNKYQSQFASQTNNQYTYFHDEDESSFKLVDNTQTKPGNRFFSRFRGSRGRFGYRGHRGRGQYNQRHDSRYDSRTGGKGQQNSQRGKSGKNAWDNRRYGGHRGRYNRYGNDDRRKDASVKVEEDWEIVREIEFNQLAPLRTSDLPEAEDLYECGSVETYDLSYDRITPKAVRPMKKSAADRNFNTCATTTTEDPIIRELRHQGQVFATDSILSTLMTASRSVNSWDIIVRRIGDKLFFDRRDGSEIDMVSVNETANEPPGEDNVGINDPRNLTLEATYINKVFGQQCLKQGEWNDLTHKNPYIDANMPKDRVASAGYRYRRWQLGEYSLVARTAVDAVTTSKKTGQKTYALIRALNEWDPKTSGDWRKKLEMQPGAVLATELKNNNCKLARWTTQAVMAGAKMMKLAYVTRNNAKNNREHSIVQVSQFKPKDFALQMQLMLENSWAVLRCLIDECMRLPSGKYLLLKDPNSPKLLLYSIPEDAFSSSEDESSSDDEGESETEAKQ